MRNRLILFIAFFSLVLTLPSQAQVAARKPRLVVNVVVSQMRYDYLLLFGKNFNTSGFYRMAEQGVDCTNARYNFVNTTTPAGLATITTGADPNLHGVLSESWMDYTTNKKVYLIEDQKYYGVGAVGYDGRFSPEKMIVSTIGDEVRKHNKSSKVISIAMDPVSSVVAGGRDASAAYWFDDRKGIWVTSNYYTDRLPNWMERFNDTEYIKAFNERRWVFSLADDKYNYQPGGVIRNDNKKLSLFSLGSLFRRKEDNGFKNITSTPIGVDMMFDMVKSAITYENLGKDDNTDLLIVTVDQTREISESFGAESREMEDAIYRFDYNLADLIDFLNVQVGKEDVLLIVTSDHGASDAHKDEDRQASGLFNTAQFKVLINGFLNTQYGPEEWVTDYNNRSLYLNRVKVFEKGISLEEMQSRAAAFAMQFRGVAQTVTATSLQNNYFSGGIIGKIQNGFHPKHSGDIMVNLMPGWIEEYDDVVSLSGSLYEYDTHVPLLWYGSGLKRETVHEAVDMAEIASTLAKMLNVNRPNAATGHEINKIITNFQK